MNTPEQHAYYAEPPFPTEPSVPTKEINPNNPPWGSLISIGAWIFSVAMILIIPSLFLGVYLAAKGANLSDPSTLAEAMKGDPIAIWISIIAIIPAHIITLLVCWLIVTKGRKFPFFETLGWKSGGMQWYYYVLILVGFLALSAVVGSYFSDQDNEMMRMISSSRMTLFTVAALAVLTAPLIEELVYRGIVYSALQRSITPWAAVIITTLLFAIVHVPQYWGSPATIALLLLLSLILSVMRMRTGNLWPCVVFHTMFNGIQSVLLIAQSYITNPAVPEATTAAYIFQILQ